MHFVFKNNDNTIVSREGKKTINLVSPPLKKVTVCFNELQIELVIQGLIIQVVNCSSTKKRAVGEKR